jgi:hypothetical protein
MQAEAAEIESNWKEGGTARVLMHAGIGYLTAGFGGAAGAAASAVATPQLSQILTDSNASPAAKQAVLMATGAALGGLVGGTAGAAAGFNEITNNGLGRVVKMVGLPAISMCLRNPTCLAMSGPVGAGIALQATKIMQDNPDIKEDDAFAIAVVGYGAQSLAGKPAVPLPPTAPTITPADAQRVYGSPPLNNPEELKAWLGNALDGYTPAEAQKWAKDFINTLPAAQQQTMGDLIMQSVQDNAVAGSRREREVRADLQAQYPNGSVQDQQYLRDRNGNIVIDPLTGTARRLDHVVIVDGKVVDVVETTSLTAEKTQLLRHEDQVRSNGGSYIRDRDTGELFKVPSISRVERRL